MRDSTIYEAKTKALISYAATAQLISVFVFAYAKSRFSHNEAHIIEDFHISATKQEDLLLHKKKKSITIASPWGRNSNQKLGKASSLFKILIPVKGDISLFYIDKYNYHIPLYVYGKCIRHINMVQNSSKIIKQLT